MTQDTGSYASRFAVFETEVKQYGRTWFQSDHAATSVIARDAEVRSAVSRLLVLDRTVGTETIYNCGAHWLPERLDVHHKLVARLVEGREPGTAYATAGNQVIPQAVVLMGMPGSGKSSLLRPIALELIARTSASGHLVVDADDVRVGLPEYKDGLGSEVVQPETAYIAYDQLIEAAYRRRAHLILDTVGDPALILDEVRYMIRAGWSVWCLCADVDVEIAVERSQRRTVETGRYVPMAYLRSVGDRPVRAYHSLAESQLPLAGSALLDTNVRPGEVPLVLHATEEDLFGQPGQQVAVWPSHEHNAGVAQGDGDA